MLQAQTLAAAVDDVEVEHAEQALIEMGEQAIPAIESVMKTANDIGRSRLKRIYFDIRPGEEK